MPGWSKVSQNTCLRDWSRLLQTICNLHLISQNIKNPPGFHLHTTTTYFLKVFETQINAAPILQKAVSSLSGVKSEHIVLFDPWPVKSPADSSLMYCKNGSLVQTAWPLRTAGLSHVSPPTLSKDLSLWDTWNTRQAECHHRLLANSDGALACFLWGFLTNCTKPVLC